MRCAVRFQTSRITKVADGSTSLDRRRSRMPVFSELLAALQVGSHRALCRRGRIGRAQFHRLMTGQRVSDRTIAKVALALGIGDELVAACVGTFGNRETEGAKARELATAS